MEKELIKITVSGRVNSGRSTIISVINTALSNIGFEVENHDKFPPERTQDMETQAINAVKIKSKIKIDIFDEQLKRESYKNP